VWVVHVKQCKFPGGNEEITGTIVELRKAKIIHSAHSPYNSPIWLIWKLDGTWHMTVDYQGLNKVTSPLHAAVPSAKDILDQLTLVNLARWQKVKINVPLPGKITNGHFCCYPKDICIV
jgi:hypothetical protein